MKLRQMAEETATIVRSTREPLKHILRSWMIFLLRIHQKTEMVGEKVLLSVTLGEPVAVYPSFGHAHYK